MSYSEQNGQVVLTMSRKDYAALIFRLGDVAQQAKERAPEYFKEQLEMLNRLNQGNPNYTPYQVEKS